MKIDCHNHANYSPDASQTLEELAKTAMRAGVGYLAVTEHMDLGFPNDKRPENEPLFDYRVNEQYFCDIESLQKKYAGRLEIVAGIEVGFTPEDTARITTELSKYPFSYIINSVHICHGLDCYWPGYFDGYDKARAYGEYLDVVRASLDAPYHYDTIGHLGYISRPAPYADKRMLYTSYIDRLDDILTEIIKRDKILEVNSAAGASGSLCLPDLSIIARYREMGGKLINYGSDSHRAEQFNNNYNAIADILKTLGFKEWSIVRGGKIQMETIN